MNVALIENGIVKQVWLNGTFDGTLNDLMVETTENIVAGMEYDGTNFATPSQPQLSTTQYAQIAHEVFKSNPEDIPKENRAEFLEYFNFVSQGVVYPLIEYPVVATKIQEWITQEKLPPLPN